MKVILALDAFKGTFTSFEINALIGKSVRREFDSVEIVSLAMADGGEGTVEALVNATGGTLETVAVHDPFMRPTDAVIGVHGKKAYMEMAQASGILKLSPSELDPRLATTFGTGEMIRYALDQGAKEIVIGVGGSATNDVGIGMAMALGAKFYNVDGDVLPPRGDSLFEIADFDLSTLDQRLGDVKITVLCDVENPLTGVKGAAHVYGAQKGMTPSDQEAFDRAALKFNKLLIEKQGTDLDRIAGSGAAGGLAGGLKVFLNADLKKGLDAILEVTEFNKLLETADYVITGEGRLDAQSQYGKVPYGIADAVMHHFHHNPHFVRVKLIAFVGYNALEFQAETPFDVIFELVKDPMAFESIVAHKQDLLASGIHRLLEWMKLDWNKRKEPL